MGALKVITKPTDFITLEEAKEALRVETSDYDAQIIGYISAAIKWAEAFTGLRISTQTVERQFDRWPSSEICLGVWPLQAIVSVKYDDTGSPVTEQTLTENVDYYSDIVNIGGKVRAINAWPSVAVKPNAIRIRMTAGYADDDVPETIKTGIKSYLKYLFDDDISMVDIAERILWHERLP